ARRSRRWILGGLAGLGAAVAATGLGLAAGARVFRSDAAAPRLPRVGYLALHRPDEPAGSPRPHLAWVPQGLEETRDGNGRNVVVEPRFAEGSAERLSAFAEELVSLPVDVIVAADTNALNVLGRVTNTVPVVMAISFDPIAFGQIESLRRPGKNFTGLTL